MFRRLSSRNQNIQEIFKKLHFQTPELIYFKLITIWKLRLTQQFWDSIRDGTGAGNDPLDQHFQKCDMVE